MHSVSEVRTFWRILTTSKECFRVKRGFKVVRIGLRSGLGG